MTHLKRIESWVDTETLSTIVKISVEVYFRTLKDEALDLTSERGSLLMVQAL